MLGFADSLQSSSRSRLRAVAVGVVAVVCGFGLVVGGLAARPASGQAASVSFSATAEAFGSRIEVTVSQAPLFPNLIDGGGPAAQAGLDSLGTARALAAHPWPGEVVVVLPGLAAGLGPQLPGLVDNLPGMLGGLLPISLPQEVMDLLDQVELPTDELAPLLENAPPLPPYPFAATADSFDNPEDRVDLGIGSLDATADRSEVTARADLDPGSGGIGAAGATAESFVRVDEDDGSVRAQAMGSIQGLQIGPVQVGTISSLARMGIDASGEVSRDAEFAVSGLRLGQLSLDLTADGLQVAGNDVPLPIAEAINTVLAGSGIEMELLEERVTDTGVLTGGLQVTYPVDFADVPLDELSGLGQGEITVTLGQSVVTLTGAPVPPVPDVDLGEVSPPEPDGAANVSPPTVPPPATESGGPDQAQAGQEQAPPHTQAASPPVMARSQAPLAEGFDSVPIYLVMVGSALAMAGVGQLLRVAAFRPRAVGAA